MTWCQICTFALILYGVSGQKSEPIVNILQGRVAGSVANDGAYFEFYGIPYADSTSGSHRFQAPSAPPSFQDTFIADRRDIRCVRPLGVGYEGTEDCLVANVFTPTLTDTAQLPVMVWIKGREFDPIYKQDLSFKHFMDKDVVVVSLNFRESILGFLCLGTETAPGNAGLKDVIAGLRWVQENIHVFGGNSNNVTLFGHGSGAAIVDLVTLSSSANGLVHKAITQSGNSFSPWAVTRDNLFYAVQVAEALGHEPENVQQLSEVFTRTSVAALMAVINELELTDNALAFAPCVERADIEGVEPFITKSPYRIMNDREFLEIPFISGYVDYEGTIRAQEALNHDWLDRMDDSFVDFLQSDLQFTNEKEAADVAEEIRTFYFRDGSVSLDTIEEYISYHGDTMIIVSTLRQVRMRATFSSSPVYLYQFSYKGNMGEPFVGPIVVDAAAHGEELAYMFYDTVAEGTSLMDLTVADILIERWTNFAKTGIPYSEISQIEWWPFTEENNYYLRILDDDEVNDAEGATLEIEFQNPRPSIVSFWEEIYSEYFFDAEGQWELPKRDDEDDIIGPEEGSGEDGSGENGSGEDGSGEDGSGENGSEEDESGEDGSGENGSEEDESGEDGSEEENSASAAVAYSFSVLALIAAFNHFHASKMML